MAANDFSGWECSTFGPFRFSGAAFISHVSEKIRGRFLVPYFPRRKGAPDFLRKVTVGNFLFFLFLMIFDSFSARLTHLHYLSFMSCYTSICMAVNVSVSIVFSSRPLSHYLPHSDNPSDLSSVCPSHELIHPSYLH